MRLDHDRGRSGRSWIFHRRFARLGQIRFELGDDGRVLGRDIVALLRIRLEVVKLQRLALAHADRLPVAPSHRLAKLRILALGKQGVQFPVSTKQMPPSATTQAGLIGTQAFIDAHPEVTQHLVDVLVDNAKWLSEPNNVQPYAKLMAAQSNIPEGLFQQELQGDDLHFRQSPRPDPFLLGNLQDSVDQAKTLGLIRRSFEAASWVEPRFVDHALAEQQLQNFWPQYDRNGKAL